jgi:hypothetical protein
MKETIKELLNEKVQLRSWVIGCLLAGVAVLTFLLGWNIQRKKTKSLTCEESYHTFETSVRGLSLENYRTTDIPSREWMNKNCRPLEAQIKAQEDLMRERIAYYEQIYRKVVEKEDALKSCREYSSQLEKKVVVSLNAITATCKEAAKLRETK